MCYSLYLVGELFRTEVAIVKINGSNIKFELTDNSSSELLFPGKYNCIFFIPAILQKLGSTYKRISID